MKSIIYGNNPVNVLDSLYITVVSILIVFLILMLISFILSFFKYIPQDSIKKEVKKESKKEVKKSFNIDELKEEHKLVAALVSIIECSENTDSENIKIRSVKEI